jgi:hypothetical protein
MNTVFVPETAPAEIVKEVVTVKHLVTPPAGTLMRATRGNTTIEFRIPARTHFLNENFFTGVIVPADWEDHYASSSHEAFNFWLADGWTFEILDTPEVAA